MSLANAARAAALLLLGLTSPRAADATQAAARSRASGRADSLALAPRDTVTVTVDEGTGMSVDVSPDGSLLAFDLLGQIFTLPIGGGRASQLTRGAAFAQQPQFSPDGRFVIFESDSTATSALWRMPVAGGAPAPVEPADTAGGRRDHWLATEGHRTGPDGRYAVQLKASEGAGSAHLRPQLVITDLVDSTSARRRVALTPVEHAFFNAPRGSAFTPDGRAFVTSDSGKLRRVELATGTIAVIPFTAAVALEIRPLVRFPQPVSSDSLVHARRVEYPRVSPGGRQVVFGAFDRLWRMPLTRGARPGGTPRRLTALDAIEYEPAWTPDGRYIAFATWSDSGGGALYRVRADGSGRPERLASAEGHYRNIAYTADGRYLVAERANEGNNVQETTRGGFYALSPVGSVSWELIWLPADGGAAVATISSSDSPPSRYDCRGLGLVRMSGESGSDRADQAVVSYDSPTPGAPSGTILRLAGTSRAFRRAFCLFPSPAGTHALLQTYGGDWNELALVELPPRSRGIPVLAFDSTRPAGRPLTTLARGAEFPHWSPDGRSFTYAFGRTLYRYDAARAAADSAYEPTAIPMDVVWPRARPRGTLALRHARLITMRGDTVIEQGDLVVRDGRIAALGASGTVRIPPEATVIEAAGRTIMPGLFDLHNHAVPTRPWVRERFPQYEANLAFGVLTSRDPQALSLDFLTLEDLLATGQILGPRVRSTGPGFGDPLRPTLIGSLADARAIIRRYADVYQVGYLKDHYSSARPSRAVQQWLAAAAAERQLNVTIHAAEGMAHLLTAALDGYGGYEHTYFPRPLYDDVRQVLARIGITLSEQWDVARQDEIAAEYTTPDEPLREKLRRFGVVPPGEFREMIARGGEQDSAGRRRDWLAKRVLAPLAAAGGRIALGAHGEMPGYSTHVNLWSLVAGGMTPLDALRSGTLRGAEALGMDRDLGSLAVGKLADVLVLDRNPLEHIGNTISLRWVLFNGHLYDAATLDEEWPWTRARPRGWWETASDSP